MAGEETTHNSSCGPLSGLKIIELEALGPVPLASAILSDLGAEVVMVVRPGNAHTPQAKQAIKRGRRLIELNLKDETDRQTLLTAIEEADVLVEGYRPGTLERLGLDPDQLTQAHPRLIVGRMTGWGQHGVRQNEAGHDINYLSLTGHLSAITDHHGRPVVPLNFVADYGGGAMFLLLGVMSALYERQHSGAGQVVDAAMVDGASMLGLQMWSMRGEGRWTDMPYSNPLDGSAPWYGTYETSDGRYMAVGAIEPKFYALLLEGLGITETAPDRNDPTVWPQLRELIAKRFRSADFVHWTKVFAGSDACVSPILTYEEALHDEHMLSRNNFTTINGEPQPNPAPRFSRTPAPAPVASWTAEEHESFWGARSNSKSVVH